MINDVDCEDLVGLYLQKKFGFCLIPSSCKLDTVAYEYLLKDPETGETITAQVKQGRNNLDDVLKFSADKIFLFTSERSFRPLTRNIYIISPVELFDFVTKNENIIPDRIKLWLSYLQYQG